MKYLIHTFIIVLTISFSTNCQAQRKANKKAKKVVAHKTAKRVVKTRAIAHHRYKHLPKRGTVVAVTPAGARVVVHKTGKFHYHNGIWYRPKAKGFAVVRPARGLRVKVLPPGHRRLMVRKRTYFYYYGTFYAKAEGSEEYEVVDAPSGAEVDAIPEGYSTKTVNGQAYYELDDVYYQPIAKEGVTLYQVVDIPLTDYKSEK